MSQHKCFYKNSAFIDHQNHAPAFSIALAIATAAKAVKHNTHETVLQRSPALHGLGHAAALAYGHHTTPVVVLVRPVVEEGGQQRCHTLSIGRAIACQC
jgi:hypothetical protein